MANTGVLPFVRGVDFTNNNFSVSQNSIFDLLQRMKEKEKQKRMETQNVINKNTSFNEAKIEIQSIGIYCCI